MMRKLKVKTEREKIDDIIYGTGDLESNETIETEKEKSSNVVPKYKKKFLVFILKENHSIVMKWINKKKDSFRVDNNTYFIIPEGNYISDNKIVLSVYYEGVSIPISHKNIEKEEVERTITDFKGNEKQVKIQVIKGLKYDSEIIDMVLNRKLSDDFTKTSFDMPSLVTIILLIGVLIVGVVNIGIAVS